MHRNADQVVFFEVDFYRHALPVKYNFLRNIFVLRLLSPTSAQHIL